ncbi:unnamed protein product [Rhodiola kirilowii]
MTSPVAADKMRDTQRTIWPAFVLAIGTATPPNYIMQSDYPDYYFRITNSDHKVGLKQKFKRICEKSTIRKRHLLHLNEEIFKQNPNISKFNAPSLNARQDIAIAEVPKLAKEASLKAIKEWGQPKSRITHLIFATSSGVDMPGADYQLLKLLDLQPSVNRLMIYQAGCNGGGTAIRLAKDLAENNRGSRVLVVCSEITAVCFHAPDETYLDSLIGQALFGDGSAAIIVGADPDLSTEHPLFEIVSASQTIIPNTEQAIAGHLRETGLVFHLSDQIPKLIADNIERSLIKAFVHLGVSDWNSLFWIAHPGGPAILNEIEKKLGLNKEKLEASRHVLREYGNTWSSAVLIVLDEMKDRMKNNKKGKDGQQFEWGVLTSFGPGLTMETIVLRVVSTE